MTSSTTSEMASSTTSSFALPSDPAALPEQPCATREPKRAPEQHVDHKIANALLKKALQGTLRRRRPTPGLLPSSAPLPALLNRSGCRATISRIQPPGTPPLSDSLSLCTRTSYSTSIAPISRQAQHNKRIRQAQAVALLPTRTQTRSLSPQAPRTTATSNSSSRNYCDVTRFSQPCHVTLRAVVSVQLISR